MYSFTTPILVLPILIYIFASSSKVRFFAFQLMERHGFALRQIEHQSFILAPGVELVWCYRKFIRGCFKVITSRMKAAPSAYNARWTLCSVGFYSLIQRSKNRTFKKIIFCPFVLALLLCLHHLCRMLESEADLYTAQFFFVLAG